jgi:putative NADH-flavin reductase
MKSAFRPSGHFAVASARSARAWRWTGWYSMRSSHCARGKDSVGACVSSEPFGYQYTRLGAKYDDKDVQERIVRRSKLDWVIVRPVILTEEPKTNAYRALVDPRDWTCGFISRADVADFLVKQIDDGAFLRRTPVLTS